MEYRHALIVADFVNRHDDGTPQPRATVVSDGPGYIVEVRSTEYRDGAFDRIATDRAHSLSDARGILGY